MSRRASSLLFCQQVEFVHETLSTMQVFFRDIRWTLPASRCDVGSIVEAQDTPECS